MKDITLKDLELKRTQLELSIRRAIQSFCDDVGSYPADIVYQSVDSDIKRNVGYYIEISVEL